ncbi:hypothetical protein B0H19DRAFT_1084012 [Mycena capillaripes]|nr:hypothetical protein B0H19DRAFT_1084012 [Mycena capillaripes]
MCKKAPRLFPVSYLGQQILFAKTRFNFGGDEIVRGLRLIKRSRRPGRFKGRNTGLRPCRSERPGWAFQGKAEMPGYGRVGPNSQIDEIRSGWAFQGKAEMPGYSRVEAGVNKVRWAFGINEVEQNEEG